LAFPLANALLDLFETQSGTVIIDRLHPLKPGQTPDQTFIRVTLEAFENTELSLNKCFRYSPSYLLFRRPFQLSLEAISGSLDAVAKKVLENFYSKLSQADYMMDEFLKNKLYPHLLGFVRSGIAFQRQGFRSTVKENLSLFLHGIPGIGKSTFVQVFAASLQRALREQLSPDIEVAIVKIPLNAYLNAWNLNQILQIQGISDWSVERMMEQALTKGHLVVLHLEECPASFELQDSLFVCLQKMLERKLWFRYPEFKSNVLFVFTSNYGPSPTIRGFCREYCMLNPPTAEMQKQWLVRKLEAALSTLVFKRFQSTCSHQHQQHLSEQESLTSRLVQVAIDADAFPEATRDIRPLNAYWISLSFALGRRLSNDDVSMDDRPSNQSSVKNHAIILKAFVRRPRRRQGQSTTAAAAAVGELEIGWDHQPVETTSVVMSNDGFFYYDDPIQISAPPPSSTNRLDAKTRTILSMCLSGDLTPAVIVLRSPSRDWQLEMEELISSEIQSMMKDETTSFVSTSIELMEAEDESKVLGESGEIRGGLFRFIDDATNPNSSFKNKKSDKDRLGDKDDNKKRARTTMNHNKEETDVCMVKALVNEIGSTFLRELLESGDKSRTHRLGVSKRGLLFVVSLAQGSEMTPQLESRAHQVLVSSSSSK